MESKMISWAEFKSQKPDWVVAAQRLLAPDGEGIGFIATVAADGRPRMAPVCPIFTTTGVYLCVARHTVKHQDLKNDGRFTLHAFLGENDEEFQFSGKAIIINDSAKLRTVHGAIKFQFDPVDPIYELTFNRALWAHWINPGQPGTRVIKQTWQSTDR